MWMSFVHMQLDNVYSNFMHRTSFKNRQLQPGNMFSYKLKGIFTAYMIIGKTDMSSTPRSEFVQLESP